jgi:hypothetical protein
MNGNILDNFISPVTGRILCDENHILLGDTKGIAQPAEFVPIENLPNLTKDKIWIGDEENRPIETDFNPSGELPDLANNQLWIGDANNRPIANTTIETENLPDLANNQLWIGDANNRPIANTTISVDNLPGLGVTDVPTPAGGFVGKIWEGTVAGRPEASSSLGLAVADIAALNAKFLLGGFIMKSGFTVSYPKAQFLDALTAGALVKTSAAGDGKLQSVVLNQNQLLIGDVNNTPEAQDTIGLVNLPGLAQDKIWKGDAEGRPVEADINNIENLPDLANNQLWIGDANNRPVANTTIETENLPGLAQDKIWKGDAEGRPVEADLNIAPDDATYILKQPNANLENAQIIEELGVGMAKIVGGGAFALAIADEDYATVETLNEIKAQCEEFKDQAQVSAEEATASAEEAAASALEATAAAGEATAAAGEATAAAGEATAAAAGAAASAITAAISSATASGHASSASNSANKAKESAEEAEQDATNSATSATASAGSAAQSEAYLNQLLNTGITLTGDVLGAGPLNAPITLTFEENPVFTGTASVTIPVGTTLERPTNPVIGMVRLNTTL